MMHKAVYAFLCFFVFNVLYNYTVEKMKLLMPLMALTADNPNHHM